MSDWNRLFVACKEATGKEIEDIYDAHLIVEKLYSKIREQEKELNKLRLGVVSVTLPKGSEIVSEANKQSKFIDGLGNERESLSKYLGFINCINWLKEYAEVNGN